MPKKPFLPKEALKLRVDGKASRLTDKEVYTLARKRKGSPLKFFEGDSVDNYISKKEHQDIYKKNKKVAKKSLKHTFRTKLNKTEKKKYDVPANNKSKRPSSKSLYGLESSNTASISSKNKVVGFL